MLYHIEYPKLELFAQSLQNYILRDLEEFKVYGISEKDINRISELVETHNTIEDETVLRADRITADKLRKEVKLSLKKHLGMLRNFTDYKFGYNSLEAKLLNMKGIAAMGDSKLTAKAQAIGETIKELPGSFAQQPEIQNMLKLIRNELKKYEKSIARLNQIRDLEKVSTQKRHEAKKELYDTVSRFCMLGKQLFADSDPARYKHYVLSRYLAVGAKSKKEQATLGAPESPDASVKKTSENNGKPGPETEWLP